MRLLCVLFAIMAFGLAALAAFGRVSANYNGWLAIGLIALALSHIAPDTWR